MLYKKSMSKHVTNWEFTLDKEDHHLQTSISCSTVEIPPPHEGIVCVQCKVPIK